MALTKVTYSMIQGAAFNVLDYGIKGDGVTDDTDAIQALLRTASGNGPVYFPAGTYMVRTNQILPGNVNKRGIQIPSNSELILDQNATIQAITNGDATYNVLCVYLVDNVTIRGGTIRGDADTHTPSAFFNGICLRIQGSTNIVVEGVSFTKGYADGCAIVYDDITAPYPECKNVRLINCNSTYNNRNGLSVIGCDGGSVVGGNYSYNFGEGNTECGIDIEPNSTKPSASGPSAVSNFAVSGIVAQFNGFTGIALAGYGNILNVSVTGNTLGNNGAAGISLTKIITAGVTNILSDISIVGNASSTENTIAYDGITNLSVVGNKPYDSPSFGGLKITEQTIGGELVTNGTFDSGTTGWLGERGTIASIAGGVTGNCLELTQVSGGNQAASTFTSLLPGAIYKLTFWVKSGTSGDQAFFVNTSDLTGFTTVASGTSSGTWTKYTCYFAAKGRNTTWLFYKNSSTAGTMLFDDISVVNSSAFPIAANNAAALALGLTAGQLYHTGGDPDVIAVVN